MKILLIINDAPYGTEKAYNALRMAMMLQKEHAETVEVRVFLMADAVTCALPNQSTPQGYYNIEVMLRGALRNGAQVGVCGTCMDARGITESELSEGCIRSTLDELTTWTQWADKVLVF